MRRTKENRSALQKRKKIYEAIHVSPEQTNLDTAEETINEEQAGIHAKSLIGFYGKQTVQKEQLEMLQNQRKPRKMHLRSTSKVK